MKVHGDVRDPACGGASHWSRRGSCEPRRDLWRQGPCSYTGVACPWRIASYGRVTLTTAVWGWTVACGMDSHCSSLGRSAAREIDSHWSSLWRMVSSGGDPTVQQGNNSSPWAVRETTADELTKTPFPVSLHCWWEGRRCEGVKDEVIFCWSQKVVK